MYNPKIMIEYFYKAKDQEILELKKLSEEIEAAHDTNHEMQMA